MLMKIGPYCQRQKCSPGTLVSGNVRFIGHSQGFTGEGVKWDWCRRKRRLVRWSVAPRSRVFYGCMKTGHLAPPSRSTVSCHHAHLLSSMYNPGQMPPSNAYLYRSKAHPTLCVWSQRWRLDDKKQSIYLSVSWQCIKHAVFFTVYHQNHWQLYTMYALYSSGRFNFLT